MKTTRGQSTGLNWKAVDLLLAPDLGRHSLGAAIDVLDSASGTGGILGAVEEHIRALEVFGQSYVATARRV